MIVTICVLKVLFLHQVMGVQLSFNRESVDLGITVDLDFVMTCSMDGGEPFNTLIYLRIQRLKADNTGQYETLAIMTEENGVVEPAFTDPKPGDLTTKEATVEGSYNVTNPMASTLTLTFKVSRMVCSDERQYVCEVSVLIPDGGNYRTVNDQDSKNLTVKAPPRTPTMTAKDITSGFDITNQGFSRDNMANFMKYQTVQLTCSGSIGSDPNTVFSWRRSSLNGELQLYTPSLANRDDGTAVNYVNCQYTRTAWIRYNMTSADAARDSDTNPLYFECSIQSGSYSTPEAARPKFYIHVHKGNSDIHPGGGGTAENDESSVGTIVIAVSIAAVALLTVVVVVVILWKRGMCPFSRRETQTGEDKGSTSHAYYNCSNMKRGQLTNTSDVPGNIDHAIQDSTDTSQQSIQTPALYTNTNIAVYQVAGESQYNAIDHDNQTDPVYTEMNPTDPLATTESKYAKLGTHAMEDKRDEYSKLHVGDTYYNLNG